MGFLRFSKKNRRSNDAALCKKNPLNAAAKKDMGGMMKGGEAAQKFNAYRIYLVKLQRPHTTWAPPNGGLERKSLISGKSRNR